MPYEFAEGTPIQEIIAHYRDEQVKLINASFDTVFVGAEEGWKQMQAGLSAAVKDKADTRTQQRIYLAEAEAASRGYRDKLREEYTRLDAELAEAIEIRVSQVEKQLSPENASFQDYAAAAAAPSEALITALDMALECGDEDAALVAFKAARNRDLDDVIAHAIDVREDWAELYVELDAANNQNLDLDPGDRFEQFAKAEPDGAALLDAARTNTELYNRMLGR